MTRNNLGDHLSWLLRNIELSTPVAPPLPAARDPFDSPFSFAAGSGQDERSSTSSQLSRQPASAPSLPSSSDGDTPLSTHAGAPGAGQGQTRDPKGTVEAREGMVRLTSAAKPKKPSLVVQQEQLLTPASTVGVGRLQRAYQDSLNRSGAGASRNKTSSPVSALKQRKAQPPIPTPEFAELDDELLEHVDLTGDDHDRSTSVKAAFGKPILLWRDDFASRPESLSKQGKKRKSADISTAQHDRRSESVEEEDDEFPDVYDLVEEELKTPATVRRRQADSVRRSPAKLRMPASDTAVIEHRTVTQTISTTQTRVRRAGSSEEHPVSEDLLSSDGYETPSGRGRLPASSTKQNASSSPSLGTQGKAARNAVTLQQPASSDHKTTRKSGRSDIILDSDDEFLTPPTRNTSFVTCASNSGTTPGRNTPRVNTTQGVSRSVDGTTPSKRRKATPNRSSQTRVRSSQSHDEIETIDLDAMEVDIPPSDGLRGVAAHSSETDGTTLVMDLFLANPSIADRLRELVMEKIKENGRNFQRALREGWPSERREQVKNEKKPLMDQKKAVDDLIATYNSHKDLIDERESLLNEISGKYDAGLDTDEDEVRVDALNLKILESEKMLRQALVGAGIKGHEDLEQLNKTQITADQQQTPVVMGTQPLQAGPPSLSKESTLIPECNSQVILQTQIPPTEHRSARRSDFRNEIAQSRHPSPPFPREPVSLSRGSQTRGHGMSRQLPAPRPAPEPPIDDLFDDEDLLQELDNPRAGHYTVSTTARNFSARQKTPGRTRLRPPDHFSDYGDDDLDMLAFAEDYEQRQSSSSVVHHASRSVFSETSGNAGIPPRARSVSHKDSNTLPKASIPKELMKHPWSEEVRRALKDRFRMSGFRHNQLEAINATLAGKDAFVLMPTGGGKSLCYQLPAVIKGGKTRGVTIVVSPLISLMQDQVDHLNALNIIAKPFNGEMNKAVRDMILNCFEERNPEHYVQLLYVTPEMVSKSAAFCNGLATLYRNGKLARLVIDEAHCVSQWGHDFRPDYKMLGEVRQKFPNVPVMALTATATQNVIVDIKHNLNIPNCQVFSQSFNRPNLYYEVRNKPKKAVDDIAELINTKYQGQTGIVYTLSRKSAENIAKTLREHHSIEAEHYHASIESTEKARVQREWQRGIIKVVVATIAFGMGIDKPDVRFVIHHYLPKSLEGYYQETGRAGRDGQPSECYLYFNYGDITSLRKLVEDGDGSREQKDRQKEMLNRVVNFCENKRDCRRVEILHYFGESFQAADCNKTCDNCKIGGSFELQDYSETAKAILSVIQIYKRMTSAQCIEILVGKRRPEHDGAQEYYGVARQMKKQELGAIVYKLAAEGGLKEENTVNKRYNMAIQYFSIGRRAQAYLSGRERLKMVTRTGSGVKLAAPKPPRSKAKKTAKDASNLPPSTNVSSPVRGGKGKQKSKRASLIDDKAMASDSGEEEDEPRGPMHANGYAKDNFVVSDEDDECDAFEPVRHVPRRRQRTLDELGPPISKDRGVDDISAVHREVVEAFVEEAKQLEEQIRNSKGLRRVLFTEQNLRQMAIRWTTTVGDMKRIPDINTDNVANFGKRFIPLVASHKAYFDEMMGPNTEDVIDLVSDEDEDDEDADEPEDDEEMDEEPLERSKYFGGPSVQAWHERFEELNSQHPPAASSSRARSASKGPSSYRGGKKAFGRKASSGRGGGGSGFPRAKSGGGITKRKASAGSKRAASGGSAKSKTSKAGGAGGRSDAGGGIGLMPM